MRLSRLPTRALASSSYSSPLRRRALSATPCRAARVLSSTPSPRRAEDANNVVDASSSTSSHFIRAAEEWASWAETIFMRALLLPPPVNPQLELVGVSVPFPGVEASSGDAGNIVDGMSSLWDGLLQMAVPKSRTTRSRKRIKNYRKRIVPDKKNIIACKICGELKLMHHLCKGCLKAHKEAWPRERMKEEMEKEAMEMMQRSAERAVAKESTASKE